MRWLIFLYRFVFLFRSVWCAVVNVDEQTYSLCFAVASCQYAAGCSASVSFRSALWLPTYTWIVGPATVAIPYNASRMFSRNPMILMCEQARVIALARDDQPIRMVKKKKKKGKSYLKQTLTSFVVSCDAVPFANVLFIILSDSVYLDTVEIAMVLCLRSPAR